MEANKYKSIIIGLLALTLLVITTGCTGVNKTNPLASDVKDNQARGESAINTGRQANPEERLPTDAQNQPGANPSMLKPIVNIFSERSSIGALGELDLKAEAIDPSGGAVDVKWSANQGKIINAQGTTIHYQAPDYTTTASISCTATDIRGVSTTAVFKLEVVGSFVYCLKVTAEKSCLSAPFSADPNETTVPIAGAKVVFNELNKSAVTNADGIIKLQLDPITECATYTDITVSYRDLSVSYTAKLAMAARTEISDSVNFYPGYNGVTTAIARGDSFANRLGTVEVYTKESCIGVSKPLAEVVVDVGANTAVSDYAKGLAVISANIPLNSTSGLQISKTGYQSISGCLIPTALNGTTLVSAVLTRAGTMPQTEAAISYITPFNGQSNVSVTDAIEIGFGQSMQTDSIFDGLAVIAENKETKKYTAINKATIDTIFKVVWKNNATTLCLQPKKPLEPLTRYGFTISNLSAKTADNRVLKSYNGTSFEFTTGVDPEPVITAISPLNNEVGVSCFGPYTVEFNTPMNPDSLYENLSLKLKCIENGMELTVNGKSLEGYFIIEWLNNNRLLKLVSLRTLRPQTAYQIRIVKCGLTSKSGKPLKDAEQIRSFTTGSL